MLAPEHCLNTIFGSKTRRIKRGEGIDMIPNPFGFSYTDDIDIEGMQHSLARLRRPSLPVDVVLDTDTFNEVDDQFALAYLLQSSDMLHLKEIYAAPFDNHHSNGPADGMERSYEEIKRVLCMVSREELCGKVYRGATSFLTNEKTPVRSEAAERLCELAMHYTEQEPLYVIGIAAATNLASAILLKPEIKDRIFVIWLGGLSLDWHDNFSFNAKQDVAAARVLLGSGVPLVLLPGRGVVDHFTTTGPELKHWLSGKNAFCDYIVEKTREEAELVSGETCWSRPISDVTAVAWLLDTAFMLDRLEPSPIMEYDHHYACDKRRYFIRYVYSINRDRLMKDLFDKLAAL